MDSTSDLFVADFDDNRVRKVSPSGIITTVAGGGALLGSSGDGGPATSAALSYPAAVTLDSANNLFVADAGNYLSIGSFTTPIVSRCAVIRCERTEERRTRSAHTVW